MLRPDRALTAEDATAQAAVFKALAEPTRLQLLALLSVCDAARPVALLDVLALVNRDCHVPAQPTVAHHLKVLSGAGLIERSKQGAAVWWALNPDTFCRAAAIVRGAW